MAYKFFDIESTPIWVDYTLNAVTNTKIVNEGPSTVLLKADGGDEIVFAESDPPLELPFAITTLSIKSANGNSSELRILSY